MSDFLAGIVYVLCFLTSAACAWLLGRSYARTGARILLWSSICFAFLAANNLVLVLDLDLRLGRLVLALMAVGALLWGFIWDQEQVDR